jgi:ribonucleotide monophosphatase NagD (HAD superfamily)
MLSGILARHHLQSDEIAVVGDRIYTDMAMARNANAMGVLVLSGETTYEAARRADPQPDVTVANLEAFGKILEEANE